MIIIRIDRKAALILALGVAVLAVNFSQALGLAQDLYPLVKSIHFNLVQAPLESSINSMLAAKERTLGE